MDDRAALATGAYLSGSEPVRLASAPITWPLRQDWPAETLALNVPPSEAWCDPVASFDCQGEAACRDCGNDLDTLCPLIALPGVLAVVAATSRPEVSR